METIKTYEKYPLWIVFLSNLVSFVIYFSGFFITIRLNWIAGSLYLVYILALEYRLLSSHCTNCYYWGKICGFGKGRVSALFFKKGDPAKFCVGSMSWKEMIPDLLVSLVPLIIGIVLLIVDFDFRILIAVILLIMATTSGNAFIRGNLTCKYCRQRESGCPAEKLFSK